MSVIYNASIFTTYILYLVNGFWYGKKYLNFLCAMYLPSWFSLAPAWLSHFNFQWSLYPVGKFLSNTFEFFSIQTLRRKRVFYGGSAVVKEWCLASSSTRTCTCVTMLIWRLYRYVVLSLYLEINII